MSDAQIGTEGLAEWRKQLVHRLNALCALLLPPALVFSFPILWAGEHYLLIALDIGIVALASYNYLRAPRSEQLMGQVVVCALAYSYLIALGPSHTRAAWLMLAVIIAALFSGRRAAILVTALNAAVLFFVYSLMGPEAPGWEHEYDQGFSTWLMFVINLSAISLAAALATGHLLERLDSTLRREQGALAMLQAEHREVVQAQAVAREEAEKRNHLEIRLREAQKLGALGRLAGGIAHDLNNMLMPVMGYADLMRKKVDPNGELREYVDEITGASNRSRDLIRQILTFSRGVAPGTERVDVVSVIQSLLDQTRPTLPEGIELRAALESDLPEVRASEIPVYQVCLNLVTNAIDAMPEGGTLTLETAPGRGACFRVYLPVADGNAESRKPDVAEPGLERLYGSALLVDDNPQVRNAIRRQLEGIGLEVREAAGAEEARAMIAEQRPDLLLTDLQMPGESGLQLGQRIREGDREIAIVLTTGSLDAETQRRARDVGIDAVVVKPFTGPELRHAIAPLLKAGRSGELDRLQAG